MKKWKCKECDTITDDDQILIKNNPFVEKHIIQGCPSCFSVNSLQIVCDEYGCEKVATFGYSTDDGFINTCGEHIKKLEAELAAALNQPIG